jgi:hypothetical protein
MQTNNRVLERNDGTAPGVVDIELFAIDLNSCTRCVGTLEHIEEAITVVRPVLQVMEVRVNVRKVVVESEEQARRFEFALSPTVRINGRDIAFETIESECDSCTDLCGCDEGTNCRVWTYRGREYTEAPVGLIVEAILRAIFNGDREPEPTSNASGYGGVPDNLKRFFNGKLHKQTAENDCCAPAVRESCCEPSEKLSCCGPSETETCGC